MTKKIPVSHVSNGTYHFKFPRIKTIYSHIPRGGGTWFKRFLYISEHQLQENEVPLKEGAVHCRKYDRVHLKTFPEHKDYFKFTMLRDPVERLLSAYRRFLLDGLGHWAKHWGCEEGMTLKEFTERVCNTPDEEADIHLVSQFSLVVWEGKVLHDYIGFYNNFNEVVDDVLNKTPVKIKPLKDSSRVNQSIAGRDTETDKEIVDMIQERYSKDYRLIKIIKKEKSRIGWTSNFSKELIIVP